MAQKTLDVLSAATYALRADTPTVAADADLHMGIGKTSSRTILSLLKFDLDWSQVKKITSAYLVLKEYHPPGAHFGFTPVPDSRFRVTLLTADFLDTDSTAEAVFGSGAYETVISKNSNYFADGGFSTIEGTEIKVDITTLMGGWAPISVQKVSGSGGGALANHGLVIERRPIAAVPDPQAYFHSDKAAEANRPYIELNYDPVPAPPDVLLTGPISPVSQIEGEAFEGDFVPGREGDTMTRVQVQVYLEGGAVQWDQARAASASETETAHFTWPLPSFLKSGIAYEWRARVRNQNLEWSPWSAKTDLVVASDPPTLTSPFPSGSMSTLNGVYFGAHYQDVNSNPMRSYRIQVTDELPAGDPLWETSPYHWDTGDIVASKAEAQPSGTSTSGGSQLPAPSGVVIVDRGGLIRRLYGGAGLEPGTYSFRVRATDVLGATSDWEYGEFTLTKGWEPDPGETSLLSGYARRQVRARIVIRGMNLNQQRFYIHNGTGGTFTLTLMGATSAAIAFDADAATVKAAIDALTGISSVTVTKTGTYYTVDFDPLDGVDEVMELGANNLTGTGATVHFWHTRGPGQTLAIIENAANIGVGEFYNSSGEFFFTLGTFDPQNGVIEPWQVHWAFEVYRGEGWKELNAGLIIDFDATQDDIIWHGYDYMGVAALDLEERFNVETSPDRAAVLFPANGGGSKYVDKTIAQVVTDQLNRLIYGIKSPLGFMTLGTVDAMVEKVTIHAAFKERLPFVAGLIESHRAGTGLRTRVRIRKLIDGSYQIRVDDNPGIDRDNIRLEWGGLVQAFRAIPFGDFGTRVDAIGRAFNALKVEYHVQPTPVASGEPVDANEQLYGRIPKVRLWQDITDRNDLIRRAKQYAKVVGKIGKQVGLGLRVDALGVKDGWDITDSFPVDLDRGPVDTSRWGSGYYTCWGWTFRVYPDGHTDLVLSLLPREDDEAADPDLIPSDPINVSSEWSIGWEPPVDGVTTGVTYFDASTGITWVLGEDGTWSIDASTVPPTPPPPHSVVVGTRGVTQVDGTATVSARIVVDPDPTPLVRRVVVAATQKESAPGVALWDNEQMLVNIPIGETEAQLESLLAGDPVYVRAWQEDQYGNASTEVTDDTVLSVDTTPPDNIGFINSSDAIEGISLDWEASDAPDFSHYELQVDDNDLFSSPLTYRLSVNKVLLPLAVGDYHTRLRAVDRTGNASAWSSDTPVSSHLTKLVDNENHKVQITPTQLVVEDGALVIKDEFGQTVLQASGFTGSWEDFIALGLFNASFSAGSAGTLSDGRTVGLPYWDVTKTNASGTAVFSRDADTNYPSGFRVRFDPGGTGDSLLILSDKVKVVAYRDYLVGLLIGAEIPNPITGASSVAEARVRVHWYDDQGSNIGTLTFTRRSDDLDELTLGGSGSSLAAPDSLLIPDMAYALIDAVEAVQAPQDAVQARVEVRLREVVAHSATTNIYLGQVSFREDPLGPLLTTFRQVQIGPALFLPGTGMNIEGDLLVQLGITTSVGDIDVASGNYFLGGRLAWLPGRVEGFVKDDLPASLADGAMSRFVSAATATYINRPIAGRAGRAIGIAWRKSAAITAGTATMSGSKNGASQAGATVVLDSASANNGYTAFATPFSFVDTDSLGINIQTNGTFAPTGTLDFAGDLVVEYEALQ